MKSNLPRLRIPGSIPVNFRSLLRQFFLAVYRSPSCRLPSSFLSKIFRRDFFTGSGLCGFLGLFLCQIACRAPPFRCRITAILSISILSDYALVLPFSHNFIPMLPSRGSSPLQVGDHTSGPIILLDPPLTPPASSPLIFLSISF